MQGNITLRDNNDAASSVSLWLNKKEVFLSSDQPWFEPQLKMIAYVIEELWSESFENLLKRSIEGNLDHDEWQLFEEKMDAEEYTLLLIQTDRACDHLYSTLARLLETVLCETVYQKQIIALLPKKVDDIYIKEICGTLESELFTHVSVVSSSFSSLEKIKQEYLKMKEKLHLIMKYHPTTNSHDEIWLATLVENLDEKNTEILKQDCAIETLDLLDEDLMQTVHLFLKNHLNIAETARVMYLHRNTLIYRLEKIMNITGLDLRNFEDAMKMSFLLMLRKK